MLGVFLWFLLQVSKLDLNLLIFSKVNKGASLAFIGFVDSIIGIYLWFWVCGNIVDTVKILILLALPMLFSAKVFFKAHANASS